VGERTAEAAAGERREVLPLRAGVVAVVVITEVNREITEDTEGSTGREGFARQD